VKFDRLSFHKLTTKLLIKGNQQKYMLTKRGL